MNSFMRPHEVGQLMRTEYYPGRITLTQDKRRHLIAYIRYLENIARGAGCEVLLDPESEAALRQSVAAEEARHEPLHIQERRENEQRRQAGEIPYL
jgi:hypothetical protein